MVAKSAPDATGTKPVTVRFDANVNGLPWRFEAETTSVTLLPGEVKTVFYKLTNTSDRETTGIANYGVSPDLAGGYFSKIQCFCFTDQTLQPGETREEAVVFSSIRPSRRNATRASSTPSPCLTLSFRQDAGLSPGREQRNERHSALGNERGPPWLTPTPRTTTTTSSRHRPGRSPALSRPSSWPSALSCG